MESPCSHSTPQRCGPIYLTWYVLLYLEQHHSNMPVFWVTHQLQLKRWDFWKSTLRGNKCKNSPALDWSTLEQGFPHFTVLYPEKPEGKVRWIISMSVAMTTSLATSVRMRMIMPKQGFSTLSPWVTLPSKPSKSPLSNRNNNIKFTRIPILFFGSTCKRSHKWLTD